MNRSPHSRTAKDLSEARTAVVESTHPLYLPTNLWSSKAISPDTANTVHNIDIKGTL